MYKTYIVYQMDTLKNVLTSQGHNIESQNIKSFLKIINLSWLLVF